MDKVTRQCPQTTTFLKRKESQSGIEPRSFCLPAYHLTARPNRLTKEPSQPVWLYTGGWGEEGWWGGGGGEKEKKNWFINNGRNGSVHIIIYMYMVVLKLLYIINNVYWSELFLEMGKCFIFLCIFPGLLDFYCIMVFRLWTRIVWKQGFWRHLHLAVRWTQCLSLTENITSMLTCRWDFLFAWELRMCVCARVCVCEHFTHTFCNLFLLHQYDILVMTSCNYIFVFCVGWQ